MGGSPPTLFSQDTNSNTPLLPETTPAAQHPAHVPSTSEIMPAEPRQSPTLNHMRVRRLVLPPGHKSFSWFFIILRGMVRIASKYLEYYAQTIEWTLLRFRTPRVNFEFGFCGVSVFNFRSFEWCYRYLSLLISKRNFYSNTTIRPKRKSLLNNEWNALIKNMSTTWTSFLFNDSVSAEITLEGTSRMIFFSALKLQSHKFITLSLFSRFPTTTLSLELKTT